MTHPDLQRLLEQHPDNGYLRFHLPRYESLYTALLQRHRPGMAILDIGISPFTDFLRDRFGRVDSLGFGYDRPDPRGDHYAFDLNDSADPSRWRRDLPPYDIIVFAEVLEHLHTAPQQVLACLGALLAPGGLLFMQTPNAVALGKRARMLLGINPYELIREEPGNPGHFREYTPAELLAFLAQGRWQLEYFSYEHYFDRRYARHQDLSTLSLRRKGRILNLMDRLLPGTLRASMFLVARSGLPAGGR